MIERAILRRKAPIASILLMMGIVLIEYLYNIRTQTNVLLCISFIFIFVALILFFIHCFKLSKKYALFFFMGITLMLIRINYYEDGFTFDVSKEYSGIVTNIADEDWGDRITCSIEDGGTGYCLLSYIKSNASESLEIGDKILFKAFLSKPEGPGNPRTFDYRINLYSKGISAVGRIYSVKKIGGSDVYYLRVKKYLRTRKSVFLSNYFKDDESRALAKGILFGDTNSIENDVYETFTSLGTAHILAVSGLHIGVIYGLYSFMNARIKKYKRITGLVFFLILVLYGTVADWTPSITRAIMLVFFKVIAELNHKKYDFLSSLSIINVIMLMVNPYALYNIGFQLSFLSALGLSIITPRYKTIFHDVFRIPITLQLFLLPYMVRVYNHISFLGVFANIISVFIVSLYVPIGIISFFLFLAINKGNFPFFEVIISSLGKMLVFFNDLIFGKGFGNYMLPSPNLFLVTLLMLLALLFHSESIVLYMERKDYKKLAVIIIIIALISLGAYIYDRTPFDDASIVFIDVGQGDSIHVKYANNGNILIDGGGRQDYNVGEKILRPYLLHNGTGSLDAAFTTHEHIDHYKGIRELGENFPIHDYISDSVMGDRISINRDIWIKVLWPRSENTSSEDENYYSRIYMINYKGTRTLVTGDITEEGERALLKEYEGTEELKCDILKVAHHGSRFSSCDAFLKETGAKVAVISVGKNNSYGHPSEDVLSRLETIGAAVYRTDEDGAVGIIIGECELRVCTNKTNKMDVYTLPLKNNTT